MPLCWALVMQPCKADRECCPRGLRHSCTFRTGFLTAASLFTCLCGRLNLLSPYAALARHLFIFLFVLSVSLLSLTFFLILRFFFFHKVCIKFITILFLGFFLLLFFMFWFLGHESRGISAPQPGIEPAPLHWKAVSTTGPPGESLSYSLIYPLDHGHDFCSFIGPSPLSLIAAS